MHKLLPFAAKRLMGLLQMTIQIPAQLGHKGAELAGKGFGRHAVNVHLVPAQAPFLGSLF
jgi:hypothetical protein